MQRQTASKMFLAAAVFNWVVASSLFFSPAALLNLFGATPTPDQSLWVQQFAGLVFVFGIGYYWAARNFAANLPIIRLAFIGKTGVMLIGLLNVLAGEISWQFMLPVSGDLCFVILFIMALRSRSVWNSSGMA